MLQNSEQAYFACPLHLTFREHLLSMALFRLHTKYCHVNEGDYIHASKYAWLVATDERYS